MHPQIDIPGSLAPSGGYEVTTIPRQSYLNEEKCMFAATWDDKYTSTDPTHFLEMGSYVWLSIYHKGLELGV